MAPLTEERRQQLELARAKAVEKRKQLGELARKEKSMKEKELQDRLARVEEFERSRQEAPKKTPPIDVPSAPATASTPHRRRRKPAPPPPSSSSSSEETLTTDDEDDDEEEVRPLPPPPPPRPIHKKARLAADVAREELQRRIQQENLREAYASIFPGHRWY